MRTQYKIELKDNDITSGINRAISIAKVLNSSNIIINIEEYDDNGKYEFSISASKDSNYVDLYCLYRAKSELARLKKEKSH